MKRFSKVCTSLVLGLIMMTEAAEMDWKTDIRYRSEYQFTEATASKYANERYNQRIRARLGFTAPLADAWSMGLRVTAGEGKVNTHEQVLSNSFSGKEIWLDRAFIAWNPELQNTKIGSTKFQIMGGKIGDNFLRAMNNKAELLWDGDLSPEGTLLGIEQKSGALKWTLRGHYYWLQENSTSKSKGAYIDDRFLGGGQTVIESKLEPLEIRLGGGMWRANTQGMRQIGDKSLGNSIKDTSYVYDLESYEAFGDLGFKVSNIPFTLGGAYAINTGAESDNQGWLAGVQMGKTKELGQIELGYEFRSAEADMGIAAFSSSDYNEGSFDGSGHTAKLKVATSSKTNVELIGHINHEIGLKSGKTLSKYQRVRLEFNAGF
jgi:hypothetical protein